MVGRDVALAGTSTFIGAPVRDVTPTLAAGATPRSSGLELRNLVVAGPRRPDAVNGVSLTVAAGEIVGIAGVEGNGQTELVEAIAGLRPVTSGSIGVDGANITNMSAKDRTRAGVSHIPEDRHLRGLILDYSIADNLILGLQDEFASRAGLLARDRIAENARTKIAQFDIRPTDATVPARTLSGGNQQKIVIAREMGRAFSVLLAAQPTRGVDVGAIELIHARLRAARDGGTGILLVSAELSEILALSDRVAVMYGGRIVAIVPRAEASEASLGPLMTGAMTS
jgi:general nucleoside transport system ATP-binding protein